MTKKWKQAILWGGSILCGTSCFTIGLLVTHAILHDSYNIWDDKGKDTTITFDQTTKIGTQSPCSDFLQQGQEAIEIHTKIINRPENYWQVNYALDNNGAWLLNSGYLQVDFNKSDLDKPLVDLTLLKDYDNLDAAHRYFDLTIICDGKTATKHIILNGWTEWNATAGITNDSGTTTMTTAGDTLVIGTHILNPIGDIVWSIQTTGGVDATTSFTKNDNQDGTFNFVLLSTYISSTPTDIVFQGINNSLSSNTITITLQQP
ncbi:MAG: hypothetical protein LBT17_00950 [Mycoplasmataceae bacterium]|nr:hypothetical protein [Mycoplasmataceae bacterium]